MNRKKLSLEEQVALLESGVFTKPKANGEQADELLKAIDRVRYPLETARLFFVRGVGRYYQFLIQDAQDDLNEALEHFTHLAAASDSADRTHKLHSLALQTQSYIGSTFLVLGDYVRSICSFRAVRDEAQKHHDADSLAYAYLELGRAYTLLGRFDLATSFLEQALAADEQAVRGGHAGGIYLCLGTIYSRTSRTEEALEHLHQALELLEQRQFAETPEALVAIGNIYFNQDDLIMAEQYATIALEFSRETGVRAMEAESLKLCGLIAHRKGYTGDAHHFLTQALAISRSVINHTQALTIAHLLIDCTDETETSSYCREVIALAGEISRQSVDSSIAALELQDKHDGMLKHQHAQEHDQLRLKQAGERLQAVSLLGNDINSLDNAEAVTDLVSRRLPGIVEADAFSLFTMDSQAQSLSLKTRYPNTVRTGQIRSSIPINDTSSIAAYCVRNRNPVRIRDIRKEGKFYCRSCTSEALRSWLAVPLIAHDEVYGALLFGETSPESFSGSDLHIIQMCANLTASALAAATYTLQISQVSKQEDLLSKHVNKTLEQLSIYDKLTGLPNRLLFQERAVPLLHQASRSGTPVAVCSIELHNNSELHDAHDNRSGDEALKIITRRMTSILRKSDLLARAQENRFVAVFNDLKQKESISVIMDKLFSEISRPFAVKNQVCSYGVHGGISFFPEHGKDLPELLDCAESARQRAQLLGYNRYAVSEVEHWQDCITN